MWTSRRRSFFTTFGSVSLAMHSVLLLFEKTRIIIVLTWQLQTRYRCRPNFEGQIIITSDKELDVWYSIRSTLTSKRSTRLKYLMSNRQPSPNIVKLGGLVAKIASLKVSYLALWAGLWSHNLWRLTGGSYRPRAVRVLEKWQENHGEMDAGWNSRGGGPKG